jgi:hypothetical protein
MRHDSYTLYTIPSIFHFPSLLVNLCFSVQLLIPLCRVHLKFFDDLIQIVCVLGQYLVSPWDLQSNSFQVNPKGGKYHPHPLVE